MTKQELRRIMDEIHEAEIKREIEESEKERRLRKLVHDNIDAFDDLWELNSFCRETTKTQQEYNGVYGRLLNTWKRRGYGVVR